MSVLIVSARLKWSKMMTALSTVVPELPVAMMSVSKSARCLKDQNVMTHIVMKSVWTG